MYVFSSMSVIRSISYMAISKAQALFGQGTWLCGHTWIIVQRDAITLNFAIFSNEHINIFALFRRGRGPQPTVQKGLDTSESKYNYD